MADWQTEEARNDFNAGWETGYYGECITGNELVDEGGPRWGVVYISLRRGDIPNAKKIISQKSTDYLADRYADAAQLVALIKEELDTRG